MINSTMTIRSIIEQYPETRELFTEIGLGELIKGEKFDKIAPFLTMKSALKTSSRDPEEFAKTLSEHIQANRISSDITLRQDGVQKDWQAVGVIPMAIHLQMLEAFDHFCTNLQDEKNITFTGRMASAEEGTGWITKTYAEVEDPRLLPDICLGRGFDFFFSKTFRERFVENNIFQAVPFKGVNKDLKGLGLCDPRGHYTVFSVIPAVLVIRKHALNGLPVPRTWEDLLSDTYNQALAMPDCSADLPRAILLTLYSRFGEEGVRRLAKNVCQRLHPSQLVKKIRSSAQDVPAISIMPYFFSQITESIPGIEVVWLEDGTIVEPLYILAKSDPEHFKSEPEAVQAAKEFFPGPKVASIFAKGHFPVLHPDIDNRLPAKAPLWWIGWDFIEKHDMLALASKLHLIFEEETTSSNNSEKECLCSS